MEIPKSYREVIEPLIAKARGFLEAGETLSPFAFVGNFATKQILPILINIFDESPQTARVIVRIDPSAVLDLDRDSSGARRDVFVYHARSLFPIAEGAP